MNSAKMTLFIAKSLSISLHNNNLDEIQKVLKLQQIDWGLFVKISTNQLVLPALFCNYKRKNLLQFLPDDLVSYMEEITNLNRNRNLQIIKQIEKLNLLLRKNGVNPVFLKGASHLVQGLYKDLGERMVWDIDFFVSKDEYLKSIELMSKDGYEVLKNSYPLRPDMRHYSRLIKNGKIAAIEIHREMVNEKYVKEFNFEFIKNDIIYKDGFYFLSYDNQKALSILSNQINDYGYEYKIVPLKNVYDFLLLNSLYHGTDFASRFYKLRIPIMCFIESVNYFLSDIFFITDKSKKVKKYLRTFKILLHNPVKRKFYTKIIGFKFFCIDITKIIRSSFLKKEYRIWLIKRVLHNPKIFLKRILDFCSKFLLKS